MSNTRTDGLHITPLTLTVCGALWLVLFSLMAWTLLEVVTIGKAMNNLPAQVADHEQRIRALEQQP